MPPATPTGTNALELDRRTRLPTTARGCGVAVFLVLAAIYLLSPVALYGDGRNAGPTVASVVTDGDLEIDEFADVAWYGKYQTTFVDGHAYDYFPWTRTIFGIPVAALVRAGELVGIGDGPGAVVRSDTWEPLFLLVPGALATAGAAALAAAAAWRYSTAGRRRSLVAIAVGLSIGLTTGYWSIASRGMWHHGPACFWLAAALLAAWHVEHGARRGLAAATVGAAAMAAAWTRPTFLFPALALGVWMVLTHRPRLVSAAAGAAGVSVAVIAVNLATFGNWLMPYYDIGRRSIEGKDSSWFGLVATLASPSRGVLVFMPFVVTMAVVGLLSASGRPEQILRWSLAAAAGVTMAISVTSPEGWWGGHAFGPRFAVDVLPILAFLAIPAADRLVTARLPRFAVVAVAALAVWSLFVNAQGAVIRQTGCWNAQPTDIDDDRSRVWDWSDAQALTGVRWVLGGNSPLASDCADEADVAEVTPP